MVSIETCCQQLREREKPVPASLMGRGHRLGTTPLPHTDNNELVTA